MISINLKAPIVVSNKILINATSVEVWDQLTNIDNWPTWHPSIKKAELNGTLYPGSTFKWKIGGITIRSRLRTIQPFIKFAWTGRALGIYAIHTWKLTEGKKHTEVTVEESMEGWPAKLLGRLLKKSVASGNQKWLEMLKKVCETRETVSVKEVAGL